MNEDSLQLSRTQDPRCSGLRVFGNLSAISCGTLPTQHVHIRVADQSGQVLAWNHSVFSSICKTCPGESPQHFHKPWGLIPSSEGLRFSTSEETAYPKPLAMAIAQAFAAVLIHAGWSPPADQFNVPSEPNLKFMRAIATTQPKSCANTACGT